MRDLKFFRAFVAPCLVILFLIGMTGCATSTLSEQTTAPVQSQPVQQAAEPATALYYDFKDVPVPKEMEIKKERSFVFQTSEFTAGSLSFSGKVEADSLISFFKNKMSEDSWRLLSYFKSPKNIMVFLKEDRFCIITIVGGSFATDLEIIVMPSFHSG
jgi:hypothetical protein